MLSPSTPSSKCLDDTQVRSKEKNMESWRWGLDTLLANGSGKKISRLKHKRVSFTVLYKKN